MALPEIMNAKQVSDLLKISVTAVHRLAYRKTLRYEWLGGVKVFRGETIQKYLDNADAQARRRGGSGQGRLFIGEVPASKAEVLASIEAQKPLYDGGAGGIGGGEMR